VILVDAGSLVALVDESDEHHARCVEALKEVREPMGTVWPAVTEALFLLLDVPEGQDAVLEMLRRGAIRLVPLGHEDVGRVRELMAKYRDQPMDLADAALVRVAERDGLDRVFTVDRRDFEVYRIGKRKTFQIIPEGPAGRRGKARRVVQAEASLLMGVQPSGSRLRGALVRPGQRKGPRPATAAGPRPSARRASSAQEGWSEAGRVDVPARRGYGTARSRSRGREQIGQRSKVEGAPVSSGAGAAAVAARSANRWRAR